MVGWCRAGDAINVIVVEMIGHVIGRQTAR